MWKTESIVWFVTLASVILVVFISSMVIFIFLYHRKKLLYEKEKAFLHEEHIKELFFTKMEIQQHTMQEIGREIHDSVNQQLTLASLYSYQIEGEHAKSRTGEKAGKISSIVNEAMAELRQLTKSLTGHEADGISLQELVAKECSRINALNICAVAYHFNAPDIQVSLMIRNYIHRIIQEFLQNSLKHSGCKNITLNFDHDKTGLYVQLKDDGRGFDMAGYSEAGSGIGLANMKRRSALLGIDFSLYSAPGNGIEVKLFIPETKLNAPDHGIQDRHSR